MSLRFGLQTSPQNVTYGELLQVWQRADALGYDSAWLFDHFMPIFSDPNGPCFEGMTMLTALGVQTQQLHVGLLVTAVGYRNPGLLAKMGATLDLVTGGRFQMGIGAGWFEAEAKAFGMPFLPARDRLQQLDEAIQILKLLWTQESSTFDGAHFHLANARCEPKPSQRPPIWVGGQGEKVTLRVVAQRADGWDMDMVEIGAYRHKLDILAGHCADAGRDPQTVRKMMHFSAIISTDERVVRDRSERMATSWNTTPEELRHKVLVGTPEQCAEQLQPYVALGVESFVMSVPPPYDMRQLELFGGDVAERLKRG